MHFFKITFLHLGNTYTANVSKIPGTPIQYMVYDVYPFISKLPQRIVFLSSPEQDQLVYQSFDVKQQTVIKAVGEAIFLTCHKHKIAVHH